MSTRSARPKEAALPGDPKWVVIEATDGDASRWPMNTTENPDAEGYVNFMQPVSVDDGAAIKWRLIIGQALAEMLGYPDLDSKSWVLKDWPEGYAFYDHNKGQLGGNVRHDLYLVGSKSVARFRSPQEFIPHAYWLMKHSDQDRSKCECKYCARKPQREISDAMGLSQRQAGSSQAHFTELPKNKERRRRALPVREGRVFATVRRAPKPIKLPKGPKQFVNPEREKDLRALLGPKTLGDRRWAREGELVWVKLDYPLPVNDWPDGSEEITFWPGIIEEVNFKAEITPRRTHDIVAGNGQSKAGPSSNLKDEDVDPWTVVHKSVYKIKLLVASKTVLYGDDHILPYQSHAPDASLLNEVQLVVFDIDDDADELGGMILPSDEPSRGEQAEQELFKRFQAFDPFPPSKPYISQVDEQRQYGETAAGAFAAAIQIASRLSMYWTPCDAWDHKIQVPIDSSDVWGTLQSSMTPAERQLLVQRALGTQAGSNQVITSQIRFQGLWWGPERIWMGDLVRLKLARYQVAPEGTEVIKKPSGPGKRDIPENLASSSLSGTGHFDPAVNAIGRSVPNGTISNVDNADVEMKTESNSEGPDGGAASRSLFLRVDGLFVAQVATEDRQGEQNECRMCGMLYELADDDWEPEGDEFGLPPSVNVTTLNRGKPNQYLQALSGGTTATPLRAVMPNDSLGTATNGGPSNSAPMPSPSSLFAPNPDLLSEDPVRTDIPMTDDAQADRGVELTFSGPLPSSESISSARPLNGADKVSGLSTPKIESPTSTSPSLSGPLKSAESVYPTPPPPSSLKFRPILRDGYEVIMPLTTLAGRYYPGLLSKNLLQARVRAALENPEARESKAVRALEGLVPGVFNAVDASRFLPRRGQMLRDAEAVAWKELVSYWRRLSSQKKNAIVIDDD